MNKVNLNGSRQESLKRRKNNSRWTGIVRGKIASIIGEGPNAKHSIALIGLFLAFITGIILSVAVCFESQKPVCECVNHSLVDKFKSVWGIVLPFISLIIGYVFGEKKR